MSRSGDEETAPRTSDGWSWTSMPPRAEEKTFRQPCARRQQQQGQQGQRHCRHHTRNATATATLHPPPSVAPGTPATVRRYLREVVPPFNPNGLPRAWLTPSRWTRDRLGLTSLPPWGLRLAGIEVGSIHSARGLERGVTAVVWGSACGTGVRTTIMPMAPCSERCLLGVAVHASALVLNPLENRLRRGRRLLKHPIVGARPAGGGRLPPVGVWTALRSAAGKRTSAKR